MSDCQVLNTPKPNRARRHLQGFTIVELMVSLAIAAVLIGFALPAFNDFTQQRQMATRMNSLILAINYARNEAARRGLTVSVQASDPSTATNEWGPGFCVVVGNPGDCAGTTLRSFEGFTGETLNGTGGLNNVGTLSFNSRGMFTGGVIGTVQLCGADTDDDPGREMSLTVIGRASTEELVCFP